MMKASVLLLLLIFLISVVYSLEINDTIKSSSFPHKVVPSKTYTTQCSTKKTCNIVSTRAPLKSNGSIIPVYTAIPKIYELCTKRDLDCFGNNLPVRRGLKKISYIPVECENIEIPKTNNQYVTVIADPNQKDVYIPEDQLVLDSVIQNNNTEYIIHDKTLHCYKKHYETHRLTYNMCITTLTPVEIKINPMTSITSTNVLSSKVIPTTTTTTSTKMITLPSKKVTTTTKNVTFPPKIKTTTTIIKTTTTKMITLPSKVVTTTTTTTTAITLPCKNVTVTITEKITVTVTENKSSPTSIDDKQSMKNCATKYQQCGGQGYNGPTCCELGSRCQQLNQWYSQCV
ncbi:hypothetical protein BCR32DRAFT_300085 [Anaeromyces robustus]|uniref:CBM1 domain-containing protein n=1 Tax=Anaeromyces robustus TaxID=1754192 RepID=A0A1Y1X3Y4_9FUNG|nr:hypothetical protein BCR32DRAFT_300085 [Anaeromyces robustus]|eukprot:ORX80521.1 hypothetical protein BCR32DRAFT_300085 [Anaeromyces robustus]